MSATIKDVAKMSNVSIATVSKYLNGGNVTNENKINIQNAIEALDYRVNHFARGLKMNKSMTVGIVIDNITNTFYTRIVSVMEDCLQAKGYSSIICETKENHDIQKRKLDFLISKDADGIIILTTNIRPDLLSSYVEKNVKIVVVDSIVNGVNCDFVTIDNLSGAYQAVEQFIINGHKKIAVITGDDRYFSAVERLKGYKRAHEDYNIPINEHYIYRDAYDSQGGYNCLKRLWANKGNVPTAVLITNYFMAVGVTIAINEENIVIPEDLSIISFDDLELSNVFKPKLTHVGQPTDKIGKEAVELLLDRIEGINQGIKIIRIPPKMIINNSIKKI